MDYETQKEQWAKRRASILAMLKRKPHSIVARTFKISRQRVYQLEAEEQQRSGKARRNGSA